MKKMIALAILLVGMTSFAQEKVSTENKEAQKDLKIKLSPEQRNKLYLTKLTAELGLTEAQKKEMSQILDDREKNNEKRIAENKKLKADGKPLTKEQKLEVRKKMIEEKQSINARIKKVLTPEQYLKWEEKKQKKEEAFMKKIIKEDKKKK